MLLVLIIIIIVLCSVHVCFNYSKKARLLWKIPGPPGRFIVGNLSEVMFLATPAELFKLGRKYTAAHPGIFRFYGFPMGCVNIYNPEDIEVILSSSKYNEKSVVYSFLKPWLRSGLLLSGGSKWQQRRKILTPAFHFNILRHFSELLEENSRRMADKLENEDGSGQITLDVVPMLSEFTLHSICETSMGTRLDEKKSDAGRGYKEAIHELGNLIVKRFMNIHLYSEFIFNLTTLGRSQKQYLDKVHSFTQQVIKERKEFVAENGTNLNKIVESANNGEEIHMFNRKSRIAMLDLLINAEKDGLIDDVGIQEEVDTFMFEGHDTTATGLTYLLLMLANHKSVQEKVKDELCEIFGDSSRPATMQDLSKMKYLERCIKESLRLYPPVHFISRALEETVTLSDYVVPAGTICHIHIFDLHRREDLFEDALAFNPNRFLNENRVGRHPFAYIPFSAGQRNCIGQKFAMMELKSAVSTILRKFDLHPVTKPSDIELNPDLVLRSSGPVYVSFIKRNEKKNM